MTIAVVIVTYNSADVIGGAIEAIYDSKDVQIVVVDNASSDNTRSLIKDRFPDVLLIENQENLGFARAVNEGAKKASGDAILLLNPDALIDRSSLFRLYAKMNSIPECGIVAPLIKTPGLKTANGGFAPSIRHMFMHSTGLSRFSHKFRSLRGHYTMIGTHRYASKVDWVTGGCMLVRKAVWQRLGGLTTRWFMYAEDIDFCLRVKDAGWSTWLIPDISATHAIGGSSKGVDGKVNTVWIRNLFELYVLRSGAGTVRSSIWKLVVSTGFLGREITYLCRGLAVRDNRGQMKYDASRFSKYRRDLMATSHKLSSSGDS